jgi:Fe-S oxidoreductase
MWLVVEFFCCGFLGEYRVKAESKAKDVVDSF